MLTDLPRGLGAADQVVRARKPVMPLRIAVQMDPIDRIDIRGDSTFAILLEAQRRGHDILYYTPPDLSLREGKLLARGQSLKVEDKHGAHYT